MTLKTKVCLVSILSMLITSCGQKIDEGGSSLSGSNSSKYNDAPAAVSGALTGTAATGAPISNAIVKIKCNSGTIPDGLTDAFGKWSMKVDDASCDGPFIVRVKGSSGGKVVDLLSVADTEDVGKIVNVTPISHIISANVLGDADPENAFATISPGLAVKSAIESAKTKIKTKLEDIIKAATGKSDISDIDLLNSAFATDHSGLDAILDVIKINVSSSTSLKIEAVDGSTTTFDPTDDNALDDKITGVDASKIAAVVESYGKIEDILIALIAYVQANSSAINAAADINSLPTGYASVYHPDFKDRGFDAHGALHQWFGLKNLSEYEENLGDDVDASFTNVKLDVYSGDITGQISFDFTIDGKLQEKAITLEVKKDGDKWKLYGDQVGFDYHAGAAFEKKADYNQTTGAVNVSVGSKIEFWIDENSDLGNARYILLYNKAGTLVGELDIAADNSDQNTSIVNDILTNGGFSAEISSTDTNNFPLGNSVYTLQFTDLASNATPTIIHEVKLNMFIAEEAGVSFPTMSYKNEGDATENSIDFSTTDTIAEYCGNNSAQTNDAAVAYNWGDSTDQQTVFFAFDDVEIEFNGYWYNFDGANPSWFDDWESDYTSAGLSMAFNTDSTTQNKEADFNFRDVNDMEISLSFKCTFY